LHKIVVSDYKSHDRENVVLSSTFKFLLSFLFFFLSRDTIGPIFRIREIVPYITTNALILVDIFIEELHFDCSKY